jgi:hypothetical protein
MLTNQNIKTNLAKLLATENINVEYRKTDTASFNIESRTLTLPIWNDMTPDMEDLLIGHEVGHALDTPKEYANQEFQEYGKGFKTFLNVVEDVRIERRIKDRYPGLRRSFSKGYSEFASRDFFKIKNRNLNCMLLIDRINLYYKIGPFFNVKFNEQEIVFIRKIDAIDTFDDVIAVCKELYDYCKEELEQKRQEALEQMKQNFNSDNDKDFDNFETYDFDDFNDDQEDVKYRNPKDFETSNQESEENNNELNYSNEPGHGHTLEELKQYDEEIKAITDEALQKSLQQMTEKKQITIGKMPSINDWKYNEVIVNYKEFLGKVFDESILNYKDYRPNILMEFEAKNKNAILYLIKEFELRKKAAELRRVIVSDTGVLDTNKLHTYKFNNDIFRKVGSITAGKNHGVVIFIDWSGSMADNIKGTIEQLITLTTFCRKINIPFDVYAFSTEWDSNCTNAIDSKIGQIDLRAKFNLLNLFSSRMRNQEYRRMANDMLNYGEMHNKYSHYFIRRYISKNMYLGGTPLNSTIGIASGIVNRFRKAYKTEVVDVIFLTDGEDSSTLYTKSNETDSCSAMRIGPASYNSISYIEDSETRKRYRIENSGVTPTLLKILKDKTDCNLIGFYIIPRGRRNFDNVLHRLSVFSEIDNFTKFKNEKFFAIDNYGYDQYFLIPGGAALSTEDEDLNDLLGNDNKEVSTRKLKGAFLKMNQNRLTNRVLLSKVIEEMA